MHFHFLMCVFLCLDTRAKTMKDIIESEYQQKRRNENRYFDIRQPKPATDGGRSLEVVAALPSDAKEFNEEILINSFEKLSLAPISEDALLHENFDALIEASKLILPNLSLGETMKIFKQIYRAEVPSSDELSEVVVVNLSSRIECLTIDQLNAVDVLIRKYYERGPLRVYFKTLHQNLELQFVDKWDTQIDDIHCKKKLMRIIRYISNHQKITEQLNPESLSNRLLLRYDSEFEVNDVIGVIVTYARFTLPLGEATQLLINKMYRIFCKKADTVGEVRELLRFLDINKSVACELTPFTNEEFIQHCTTLASDRNDVKSAFDVLYYFNGLVCHFN